MVGEHGDICVVELLPSPGDMGMVTFEAYYDTLRNTRDILLKYPIKTMHHPIKTVHC